MAKPARAQTTCRPCIEHLEDRAVPATLHVGTQAGELTIAQAATTAKDGDVVQIDAGTYHNVEVHWTQNQLTIQGLGKVILDDTGYHINNRKGIFVIGGNSTTVENIQFQGAHDDAGADRNWAGIRQEGDNLTVRGCSFLHNDDGILGGGSSASDVVVTNSEFGYNGYGDGYSHNMYIAAVHSFTLEYSYSHDSNVGHLVKSRALNNYVLYNKLIDASGTTSYEVDLPQGGTSYLIGNSIEQGPNSQNPSIIAYGEEGLANPVNQLYVVNNTIVNDLGRGTFVWSPNTPSALQLANNLFVGAGTVLNGTGTQNHNLQTNAPGFVNAAGYDYHLTAGSPAIDQGVDPGSVNGTSLVPQAEYVDVASSQPRVTRGAAIDLGAYEFASVVNQPPTVAQAARATNSTVAGKTVGLSVLGADDGGEANLTYTWSVSGPSGTTFSANASNAAKNVTATFSQAGQYTFTATITDGNGQSITSSVNVVVTQTLSALSVSPSTVSLTDGTTRQFTASAVDQFGQALASPSVTWSLSGSGTISQTGLYTAPASGKGQTTVKATAGTLSATATVTWAPAVKSAPLVLHVSEDAYRGNARYVVLIDGQQVGGVRTATALHSQNQSQTVTIATAVTPGPHTVSIKFVNDAWGGTASTDRNLYIDSLDVGGIHYAGKVFYSNGIQSWQVTFPTTTNGIVWQV